MFRGEQPYNVMEITPDWLCELRHPGVYCDAPCFIKGKFFYMTMDNNITASGHEEVRKYRFLGRCENKRAIKIVRIKPAN